MHVRVVVLLTTPIAFLLFSLPSSSSQRRLDCGDFKGLRRFRQSLLFSSSIKKTKRSSAHRVASIMTWPGRRTIRSLVCWKATRNMPFHGIEILKPVVLLTKIKIHHHVTFCGWPPVSALTEKTYFSFIHAPSLTSTITFLTLLRSTYRHTKILSSAMPKAALGVLAKRG